MANYNLPGQTLGIIGNTGITNELARAAKKSGYKVRVYPNQASLMELAEKSDLLLFESALVDTDLLKKIKNYIEIPQLADVLTVAQDRYIQKAFLENLNINVLPYTTITSIADIEQSIAGIGFPCILKTIRLEEVGLDNVILYSREDYPKAQKLLETGACILESWITLDKELAVSFVIGKNGQIEAFPVTETFYQSQHLRGVSAPAKIDKEIEQAVLEMGHSIAKAMATTGLLTIEFFLTAIGNLYIKQVIVGPHRLLDYTLNATNISQYDAFVKAVCGLPLPKVIITQAMTNYSFKADQKAELFYQLKVQPNWYLHMNDDHCFINTSDQDWQALNELL